MELDWEKEETRDNVVAGAVGAFLGSLIGVACIVLVNQLGYVASICGLVMEVCCLKGYALLGGRLSRRGAVISGAVILLMTYIANKLCFAVALLDALDGEGGVSFFAAYQGVSVLLQDGEISRAYYGNLAMLYLFTLLGGAPVIVGAFRDPTSLKKKNPDGESMPVSDQPEAQGEIYPFRKNWMRPLRLSAAVPLLVLMVALLAGAVAAPILLDAQTGGILAIGGFLSILILFFIAMPAIMLCNTFHVLYARVGGVLWRVDLRKFCLVQDWEKLPMTRQSSVKQDILREINTIQEGGGPNHNPYALTPLHNPQVERETNWYWKVSYETEKGRRKKLTIPKGYPGLTPAPGYEEVQSPVPGRWMPAVVSLLAAAAVLGACFAFSMRLDGEGPALKPNPKPDTPMETNAAPEAKDIPIRVPESAVEYEMSEIWFRMDAAFENSGRSFLDSGTGTVYQAHTQYGVDGDDAWDTLSQYISQYHTSSLYDRFDAVYLDAEPLAPRDEGSRYNIMSVYLTDGRVFHTAIVLSNDGAMFVMEAGHNEDAQSVDEVLSNLMYTIQNVRFEGPAVTEENYQSQIHVSEVRDCAYMAAAYIRTDLFGHDAFVDAFVPYSESPAYFDNGKAVQTEAHGLRVYASILPGENAKEVVDAWQDGLAASGRAYEEDLEDELYREDLDAACKLTVYEENGQKRYAVLYADSKWDGYYLLREITGLPELVDGEYSAVLAELEDIIGLTVPALEDLGQ